MDEHKRNRVFNFFRKNPFASPAEISKEAEVDYIELLQEMDSNKDFKKSIESIRDTRDGITSL